ncbi:MAG TPA: hypothetical protein VLS89_04585, partial [Candidatus Nanopelagicales bacterium]|nr:hypothetical protein [Candidatus Nanopelagicales bacterium]
IFDLAERFEAQGDRGAQVATLRYLIERYPSSRFAERARQDLEALGERPPEAKPAETKPAEAKPAEAP